MRKRSLFVLCFVLAVAVPALGVSDPPEDVQQGVSAQIVSISRTVIYNYDHFDGPVIVYETPRPQLTVSVLIQPVDEPALQDVFLAKVQVDGEDRNFSWTWRIVTQGGRPAYVIDLLLDDVAPTFWQRIVGRTVSLELEMWYGVEVTDGHRLVAEKRPAFAFELDLP